MLLKEYIQHDVLAPRLKQSGILVMYDPDKRYRDLCCELATENRRVVDTSESSIESREIAVAALQQLGRPRTTIKELLVCVPRCSHQN